MLSKLVSIRLMISFCRSSVDFPRALKLLVSSFRGLIIEVAITVKNFFSFSDG